MISLCVSQVASVQTRGASFFSSRWTLASTGGKVWDVTALLCQLSIAWSLTDNSKPLLIPQFYCFSSSWQSCSVAIKRRNSWPRNDDDHTEITKVRVYYFIYLKGCWPERGRKPPTTTTIVVKLHSTEMRFRSIDWNLILIQHSQALRHSADLLSFVKSCEKTWFWAEDGLCFVFFFLHAQHFTRSNSFF